MTRRGRVQRDVGVAAEPLDPAQHRVVGAGAAADGVDDRQPDGDDERLEHAEDDRRSRSSRPRSRPRPDRPRRARARRCGSMSPIAAETITAPSTAFGRYCTGSVRKSRITSTVGGGDQARDLAARAHAVVDRRARAARADREALGEAGRGVRGAHRQQFLGRAHVLVVLAGERARGQDLVRERDEEDAERRRHERERRPAKRGSAASKLGSPAGICADHGDPVRLQVERPREPDRDDDDEQRRRQLGQQEAQPEQQRRARSRRRATVAPLDARRARAAPPTAAAAGRGRRSRARAASRAGR